jgi:hypothetical protein
MVDTTTVADMVEEEITAVVEEEATEDIEVLNRDPSFRARN